MGKLSVAIVVPALDEELALKETVEGILAECAARDLAHVVYVVDDGSTDATGRIADTLASAYPGRVDVVHHQSPKGLGFAYWSAVDQAKEDFIMMIPGDGEIPREAVGLLLDHAGKADLIVPRVLGQEQRPLGRRLLSKAFTALVNGAFGLRLGYYNGPCLLRRDYVAASKIRARGFAYMAGILVPLVREGKMVKEIDLPLKYRAGGRSKALSRRNALDVLLTLARLVRVCYTPR